MNVPHFVHAEDHVCITIHGAAVEAPDIDRDIVRPTGSWLHPGEDGYHHSRNRVGAASATASHTCR